MKSASERKEKQWQLPVVGLVFVAGAIVALGFEHYVLQKEASSSSSTEGNILYSSESNLACEMLCELSAEEIRQVANFVIAETAAASVRNLSDPWQPWLAGPSAVELFAPPKREVLRALDHGDQKPKRFARVTIAHPRRNCVIELKVGPVGDDMRIIEELRVDQQSIPFSKRPTEPGSDALAVQPLLDAVIKTLGKVEVLDALLGPGIFDQSTPSMQNDPLSPPGERYDIYGYMWLPPASKLEAFWLHPIPLNLRVNTTHINPKDWNLVGLELCGVEFETAQVARQAYLANEITCHFSDEAGNLPWEVPNIVDRPQPPRTLAKTRAINWGAWSLVVSGSRPSQGGPALFDIRFNDERILYELSLQDAMAAYSGTPFSEFFYSDAAWSLSQFSTSLEPGVDCPEGAIYFSSPIFYKLSQGGDATADPSKAEQNFWPTCAFEFTSDHTIWRHMQNSDPPIVCGRTRKSLVVRSIATVGNYDYISSVEFREDGEIEVSTRFAGYIESRHYDPTSNPQETEFSTILRPDLAGPVHSHIVAWKADFDIAGSTKNALQITRSTLDKNTRAKALEKSTVSHEGIQKSTFVANPSSPALWTIVDRTLNDSNALNFRGYAITLASFASIQVLDDDHPFTKAMSFSKYHLAITKHHDSEYRVTSPYAQYDAQNPYTSPLDVDTFLADSESLLDEDLVAWISTGREHITRQEDLPLVSNFGTHFSLQPMNFFSYNVAASSPDK